ncbi:MAG: alpha/beta fold hydrolase [Pseudomonadota bacterium]
MAKPPLLFIHGMWSTPAVWDDLVRHFEGEGYKCLAPALPFHERDGDNRETADPLLATIGVQDYVDALCAAVREAPAPPVIIGQFPGIHIFLNADLILFYFTKNKYNVCFQ